MVIDKAGVNVAVNVDRTRPAWGVGSVCVDDYSIVIDDDDLWVSDMRLAVGSYKSDESLRDITVALDFTSVAESSSVTDAADVDRLASDSSAENFTAGISNLVRSDTHLSECVSPGNLYDDGGSGEPVDTSERSGRKKTLHPSYTTNRDVSSNTECRCRRKSVAARFRELLQCHTLYHLL